jgi:hypothetical protein
MSRHALISGGVVMRTLAIGCAALTLAGCATRIGPDDVDEAVARQAADTECRRLGFEPESEDYKQCMATLARPSQPTPTSR